MMSRNQCLHADNIVHLVQSELCSSKKGLPCSSCEASGPNLWICLQKNCLQIGCSDKFNDHSTEHFDLNRAHCIQMNLSSQRVWCYICEFEVFLQNNNNQNQYKHYANHQRTNSMASNDSNDSRLFQHAESLSDNHMRGYDSEFDEDEMDNGQNGLCGLQNIANTCYMNSALQALSNSPPLTGYFLDCGQIVDDTCNLPNNQSRTKPGLAKSYHRLIKDMWINKRRHNGYIVPNGILQGIRIVQPMFRGFQQHDTQEFLRCFMDQLHEELKEITPAPPNFEAPCCKIPETCNNNSPCPSPSPSQSEAEYETCDSGVSEQSSLSDEVSSSNMRSRTVSRSPSPPANSSNNQRGNNQNMMDRTGSSVNLSGQNTNQSKDSFGLKNLHRSIISDIFDGKLLSSVQCLTCDRVSTREETFQDLSLPIPGKDHLAALHQSQGIASQNAGVPSDAVFPAMHDSWIWWFYTWLRSFFWGPAVSLHDCMAAFFSADELKGDNMYSCEKCNKLRNGVKFSRVLALPEMLCVHLKRFRHDLSYSSKINSPVNFPLTGLDMRPYLHNDCKSKISAYDLSAIICHHGTVGSGHYTCFAKHQPSGKWFEYDDQLVTQVPAETVQNCEAYVLFYRKHNGHMTNIRSQAMELVNSNPYQASDIKFFVSKQWLNRFNHFSEPGPIDNWSILCPHGNLLPSKAAISSSLVVQLPQMLWDFLYERFGGGPVCNHPFECETCKIAADSLLRRQKTELEAFTAFRDEFQYTDNTSTLFAISMEWFRKWQAFVNGTGEEPGPINNSSILLPIENSNNITINNNPNNSRSVRQGSDYAQINLKLWRFFYKIYEGGPEIILRVGNDPKIEKEAELIDNTENLSLEEKDEVLIQVVPITSPLEQSKIMKDSENESKQQIMKQLDQVSNPSILKPVKSVSFEDKNEVNNDEIGEKVLKNQQNEKDLAGTSSLVSKKAKQIAQQSQPPLAVTLDIGKKDKRRGVSYIKKNGLFGAEGKYSDYKYNHIPDDEITVSQTQDNKKIRMRYDDARSDSDEELISSSSSKSRKIEEDIRCLEKNEEPSPSEFKTAASETQNPTHTRRKPKRHGKRAARVE